MHHKPSARLEIFRQRLRFLRKRAGLTQAEFAEKIGAGTDDVIMRLERGAAKGISLTHLAGLLNLANEMGFSLGFLLGEDSRVVPMSEDELKDALVGLWAAKRLREQAAEMEAGPKPNADAWPEEPE